MSHVVLLGDSIFDNGRYVPGGPAAAAVWRPVSQHDFTSGQSIISADRWPTLLRVMIGYTIG